MERGPINVTVAVDERTVPAWTALVIDQLLDAPFVELRVTVLATMNRGRTPTGTRILDGLERLDRRLSRDERDAFAPTPLRSSLPVSTDPTDAGPADVLVDLTAVGVAPERAVVAAPRIWRLQHPGGLGLGQPTAAFRTLRQPEALIVTELVERAPGPERVLYRSTATAWPRSLYRSRNAACWKSAHFVLRALAVVARDGWDTDPQPARPTCGDAVSTRSGDAPPVRQVLTWAARTAFDSARSAATARSRSGSWFVAIRRASRDGHLPRGFADATVLAPPPAGDYADPFLHASQNEMHLFLEEVRPSAPRGVISWCEVAADGSPGRPQVVLEEAFHLSYPQVFEHDGRVYMLPETAEAGEVRLYVATAYPHEWRLERVLLPDTTAFDPTLVRHEGRLWLFAVVPVAGGAGTDELAIFHAERLAGPWRPHRANPVVSDARCARPAGRLQRIGQALVRPAQDCSHDYGRAVAFQRIDVLTPTEYRERTIGRLEPGWKGTLRTHTYNRAGAFEVADGYRR